MGCLSAISKYLLFIFNLVIFVCAILFIVYGVLLLNSDDFSDWIGVDDFSISTLAIVLGVFVALIAFFGCCGAIKENSCLLTTYAIILLILFILQVIVGILAFVAVKNGDGVFDDKIRDGIKEWFDKAKDGDKDARKDAYNMQREFECCGVDGPTYWGIILPNSCCGYHEDDNKSCSFVDAYQDGCSTVFSDYIKKNGKIIGGIAIGFSVIELLGAIFAFCVRARN